jgi:hypothetical protein
LNRSERRRLGRKRERGVVGEDSEPVAKRLRVSADYDLASVGHEVFCGECVLEAKAKGGSQIDFLCSKCGLLHFRMVSCSNHAKAVSFLSFGEVDVSLLLG